MLAGLPLGAALFWWSQMSGQDEALQGPFPPVWEDDDNDGEAHQEGCRCLDCSGLDSTDLDALAVEVEDE